MKVSIIVPVYNSVEFIQNSINSVLKQDYHDYELLLIDDGSTDGSGDLCDQLADTYEQIKVIHKQNGGLCSARNRGIEEACGRYLLFMDNDDEYLPHLLSDNIAILDENKVDWVRFSRKRITTFQDGNVQEDIFGTQGIASAGEIIITDDLNLQKFKEAGALYGIWNAVFKAEIIKKNHLLFDEEIRYGGEDWVFNLNYLKYVNRIAFNGNSYYLYFRRYSHSISTSFNENRLLGVLKTMEAEQEYLHLKNLDSQKNKILLRAHYLFELTYMLLQDNCTWAWKTKVHYMKDQKNSVLFNLKIKKADLKFLKSIQKIQFIMMHQFYFGNINLGMRIVYLRSKLLKEKTI